MGRFKRNPEPVLCSMPVKVEMLRVPGLALPVVPVALSAPLSTSHFFPLRHSCQKAFLTPSLRFSLASPPPSSLADLQIYLCYKKQKEHIVVKLLEQILWKLTQEILESWPREEKWAQQETTQKSFLRKTLLCSSVQHERLKSTEILRHAAEGGGVNGGKGCVCKLSLCHQLRCRESREALPPS